MNVLSLFDGMSCGQIALKELGANVTNYYASEIDRYAIEQTHLNFPDTIQLGDVREVSGKNLPKIDLLIGGSPCPGFSIAGSQRGMDDPRSALFMEFVRILKECREVNPDIKFMFENVNMADKNVYFINEQLGCLPIYIDSALVSAQHRLRLYWTNIRTEKGGIIPTPRPRGINIADVIGERSAKCSSEPIRLNKDEPGKKRIPSQDRIFDYSGKAPALARSSGGQQPKISINGVVRRMTVDECCKLQTIPDWYIWNCSDRQRNFMIGNGWTIEVIKHLLGYFVTQFEAGK